MNSVRILTVSRFLMFAVWIALAVYCVLSLWLGFVGMSFPYQLDYGEGIVLWFARELAHGVSIYKGMLGYPYASSNYPPVSMFLSALLMPLLGDGYTGGRLLNFASALIVAGLIYGIVRVEAKEKRPAMLAALFFIGAPYVYHWVPLFRADLIGLGLTFAGIYFAWQYERMTGSVRKKRVYFILLTLSFLLALYTKQTLIAGPAAAFLAMFFRDRRAAFLFASSLVVVGGAIYLGIDWATQGGFTFGLIDSNATVFLPNQLFELLKSFGSTFAVLVALAAWEWIRRVRGGEFSVLEAYGLTSVATLAFAGRVGAWENYFFEAIAIVCVLAGCRLSSMINQPSARGAAAASPALSLAASLLLVLQLLLYAPDHDPRIAADLVANDLADNRQLAALLAHTNGTIISEDMGALVTSGKQVAYYTFQYSSLARSGKWDQSWELNGMRNSVFPLVVLERGTREDVDHYRRFTREFVSTLDRYYEPTEVLGKYEVYSPAPLDHVQSIDFGDSIAMIGWSSTPLVIQSHIPITKLSIVWQSKRVMTQRYTVFVHLENASGEMVAQADLEPHGGAYPTPHWAAGENVREEYTLTTPNLLAAGKYVLRVGWYDSETGERLSVQGSADDSVMLTTFETLQ